MLSIFITPHTLFLQLLSLFIFMTMFTLYLLLMPLLVLLFNYILPITAVLMRPNWSLKLIKLNVLTMLSSRSTQFHQYSLFFSPTYLFLSSSTLPKLQLSFEILDSSQVVGPALGILAEWLGWLIVFCYFSISSAFFFYFCGQVLVSSYFLLRFPLGLMEDWAWSLGSVRLRVGRKVNTGYFRGLALPCGAVSK